MNGNSLYLLLPHYTVYVVTGIFSEKLRWVQNMLVLNTITEKNKRLLTRLFCVSFTGQTAEWHASHMWISRRIWSKRILGEIEQRGGDTEYLYGKKGFVRFLFIIQLSIRFKFLQMLKSIKKCDYQIFGINVGQIRLSNTYGYKKTVYF